MDGQPEIIQKVMGYVNQGWDLAQSWLLSPAAWSQFGLLIAAFLAALVVSRKLSPTLTKTITPAPEHNSYIAQTRRFVLIFLPLLLPLLAYMFTGLGEQITRSIFGSGAVIAFGKRVFLFLAARALVNDIVKDSFLKLLGKYLLIPAMALYALSLLDDVSAYLTTTTVTLGNISFSIMAMVRGVIAGSLLFWFGRWSNDQSAAYIGKQDEMRPATRQLAVKTAEIMIFGLAFLMLMNIMGST